jgi:DNA modification methylase
MDNLNISFEPFKRSGFFYKAIIVYDYIDTEDGKKYKYKGEITLRYDFIGYHLIKLFHGKSYFNKTIQERIHKLKDDIWLGTDTVHDARETGH